MQFDHTTETITPDLTNILTVGGSGAIELPSGPSQARPLNPIPGALRFNSSFDQLEFYVDGEWVLVPQATSISNGTVATTVANYSVGETESVVLAGNALTVTLPQPSTSTNREISIKRIGNAGPVLVTSLSGAIDGQSTISLATKYTSITVASDGTNWWII